MPKIPEVNTYIDDEEKALIESIDSTRYRTGKDMLTPARLNELKKAAKATINDERVKISLRIQKTDLERIKAMALANGMPYQTLINSILHQAVT